MSTPTTIRALIVDDDDFHRRGVRLYLQQKGFAVLEAGDAETAWRAVSEHRPEVVVLDIELPPGPHSRHQRHKNVGVELAQRIKTAYPSLGIVLFSAHRDQRYAVLTMLQAEAQGLAYKLKGCPPAELLAAIEAVREGRIAIDPGIVSPHSLADDLLERLDADEQRWVKRAVACWEQLTPRERDIAKRLAASHNIKGIVRALHLAPKTVERHIGSIYDKLDLNEMLAESPGLRRAVVLAKACLIHDLRTREQR